VIFSRLVKVANSIENAFLWIHKIELKMVQRWSAWSAPRFSIGWQFLIYAFLETPSAHAQQARLLPSPIALQRA
jgi:hypothetical protein